MSPPCHEVTAAPFLQPHTLMQGASLLPSGLSSVKQGSPQISWRPPTHMLLGAMNPTAPTSIPQTRFGGSPLPLGCPLSTRGVLTPLPPRGTLTLSTSDHEVMTPMSSTSVPQAHFVGISPRFGSFLTQSGINPQISPPSPCGGLCTDHNHLRPRGDTDPHPPQTTSCQRPPSTPPQPEDSDPPLPQTWRGH